MNLKKYTEKLKNILESLIFYCTDKPKEWYWNIWWYIRNRITFDKVLRSYRTWDSQYQLDLFAFGLEQLAKDIENGLEEPIAKTKKVLAIQKLIKELKRDIEQESYNEVYGSNHSFEFEFNEDGTMRMKKQDEKLNKTLSKKYNKLLLQKTEEHFNTIDHLLRGQSNKTIQKIIDAIIDESPEDKKEEYKAEGNYKAWAAAFDGSGIYGWWE